MLIWHSGVLLHPLHIETDRDGAQEVCACPRMHRGEAEDDKEEEEKDSTNPGESWLNRVVWGRGDNREGSDMELKYVRRASTKSYCEGL